MLLLVTAVVLAGAPPPRVATTEWTFSGVDAVVGEAFLGRFATQLAAEGLKVTTPKDIAGVLGLERQKALLGCSDDGAVDCLAELTGALGVDAVISGSVVKVGTGFTVTLRAVAARTGAPVASATGRLKSEDEVQDWLDAQARELAVAVTRALAPEPVRRSMGLLPWVPAIAGVALAAGGAGLFVVSGTKATQLANWPQGTSETSPGQIRAIRSDGALFETGAIALFAFGGAAVVASILWVALDAPAAVALGPAPGGGAWVWVSGALP